MEASYSRLRSGSETREDTFAQLTGLPYQDAKSRLRQLEGSFIPCIGSLLPPLLFVRLGWGIGRIGFIGTLLLALLVIAVSILTSISVSVIMRRTRSGPSTGGSYLRLSQALGGEVGGPIGFLFIVAHCATAALNMILIGHIALHHFGNAAQLSTYAYIITLGSALFLCIALCAASVTSKAPTIARRLDQAAFVVALIAITMLLTQLEAVGNFDIDQHERRHWTVQAGYSSFQAVTVLIPIFNGLAQGSFLSSDLHERMPPPGRTKHLYAAFAISFLVVLLLSILQASGFSTVQLEHLSELYTETMLSKAIASFECIVATFNVFGSTVSASLLIRRLHENRVLPYSASFSVSPLFSMFAVWLLTQCLLLIGNVNDAAQFVTSNMCLLSFVANTAMLLLATFTDIARRYNIPARRMLLWKILLGIASILSLIAGLCTHVYFGTSMVACLIALYLLDRRPQHIIGDVSQSIMFFYVRKYLLRLDTRQSHGKLWRPSILLLVDSHEDPLLDFCNHLKKGGLYIVGASVDGDLKQANAIFKNDWPVFLEKSRVKAVGQLVLAPNARQGVGSLLSLGGLGTLTPNTITVPMLHATEQSLTPVRFFNSFVDGSEEYIAILSDILAAQKNLVIGTRITKRHEKGGLHVWITDPLCVTSWDVFRGTSLLLVQLAHILFVNRPKRLSQSNIRFFVLTSDGFDADTVKGKLVALLHEARIEYRSIEMVRVPPTVLTSMHGSMDQNPIEIQETMLESFLCLNQELQRRTPAQTEYTLMALPLASSLDTLTHCRWESMYTQGLSELTQGLANVLFVASGDTSDVMSREI